LTSDTRPILSALRGSGLGLTIGPVRFLLRATAPVAVRHILDMYHDYPLDPDGGLCDGSVIVGYTNSWRGLLRRQVSLRADVPMPFVPLPARHAALSVEMGMNWFMATAVARRLLLHASVVERGGRAIITSGNSGSGKSTLGAALGCLGWRFFADEFGVLDTQTGQVWPFPRPCSLKNQSIDVLDGLAPASRFSPVYHETPRGTVRFLRPTDDAIQRMDEPATPALLLFPTFGAGFEPQRWRMRPSEAFARLIGGSPNYETVGRPAFDLLSRMVKTVPAYGLRYASLDDALKLTEACWTEVGGDSGSAP